MDCRWGFVCKMSLKAPFRSYKSTDDRDWPICCTLLDAESTGFGPKRLRCSVPPLFPIEHGRTSDHVLLGAQITWSPRQQVTTNFLSHQGSTRVTGLHPKKVKQASKFFTYESFIILLDECMHDEKRENNKATIFIVQGMAHAW